MRRSWQKQLLLRSLPWKIQAQTVRVLRNLDKHAGVISGPFQGQDPNRCLKHPPQSFFCASMHAFSVQCWPYLAEYLCQGAAALGVPLQQWDPFSFHSALLHPVSRWEPAGRPFLSTHSIRPLSFAVIHYCRRRSVSCVAMQMRRWCRH